MPQQLQFLSGGTAIRVHAVESDTPAGTKRPAVLLLHGSGGHVDSWASHLAPLVTRAGLHLFAPFYFDRTKTARADLSMFTDGVHVPQWLETVRDSLQFVASRPGVDPERIVLAGISLGAFLSLALGAQLSGSSSASERRAVRAIIDISGGLVPPFDAATTRAFPPVLILHGAADNIVPVTFAHELERRLIGLQVRHRTEILPGEGHWFSAGSLPRILLSVSQFLQEELGLSPA